ncbi:MAG: hypothetical protein AB1630_11415 [bacterium]
MVCARKLYNNSGQAAINAATSGDTVYVAPGSYTEALYKRISLIGGGVK